MSIEEVFSRISTDIKHTRYLTAVFAVILVSAALYFGRIVFEPIAFMLFAMALLGPFQKAVEVRMGKGVALILTLLLTLILFSLLVGVIVWSIGDIVHWGFANVDKFQSLYMRVKQWLDERDIFVVDLSTLNASSFIWVFQLIAAQVNNFVSFALIVFLFLIFGLAEMEDFRIKLALLDKRMSGWSLLETSGRIAEKIRKYMLIRTIASAATGVAVFLFTLAIGLELAVAWGVISFVLNYIPYVGPLVAVILPVIFATAQFESWPMVAMIFGSLYLIQFVIGSYLEPVLTGNALAISPFVMLVAFLIWDFLWGMPGAFIGLPVTIALFTIWEQNPTTHWIANLMSTSGTDISRQTSKADQV
ncbi:MAG: AI-2E family transporter [Alphaproteobacteria bacterium]|nr:AI-2E family transporter [Alphaproteobacteria bacterium]